MLRQIEVQLAQGKSLALACKEAGVSEQGRDRLSTIGFARTRLGLPASVRHPRFGQPPTHISHQAVVSPNPAQNPGQVKEAIDFIHHRRQWGDVTSLQPLSSAH